MATPVAVYASHSFNDVPNTNTFHDDIAWLAEAGVTRGCNPPDNTEFCPDDEVTREQMAAFMRRFAQYLDAEDGTPGLADHATTASNAAEADSAATANTAQTAQNAEKLDGKDLAELAPRAAFNSTTSAPNEDFALSAEITAPARGILLMSGGVQAINTLSDNIYGCRLEIDNGVVTGSEMFSRLDGESLINDDEDCTTSGAAVVDPGTYTIDLEVVDVAAETFLNDASVWVLWVPFGGTGAVPASITQLEAPDTVDEPTDERLDE